MISAPIGVTYPQPGVIAASPAIAPLTNPRELGLPLIQLMRSHASPPAAAAMFVVTNAWAARPFAPRALPALNPNQPNQRSAAPRIVRGVLFGSMAYFPKPTRLPMTRARASAANPELICTTVPPAKSRAPNWAAHPPPQTQWARGSYTMVVQRSPNIRNALNLMRSANPDVIIATVTVAKTSWNTINNSPGIAALYGPGSIPTLFSPIYSRLP